MALMCGSLFSQAQSGCTDPAACNFDPVAVTDDGSCLTDYGCTYALACNYDASATCDDGTCNYPNGCLDPFACNYNEFATCDDGSCSYVTPEVNDDCCGAVALSFGSAVTVDNTNSCINGVAINCTSYQLVQDMWYTITSTDGSLITISTTLNGTLTDTQIAIYDSFSYQCYGNVIACNQDMQAAVTFDPDCGTTYYIQVGGQNGAIGTCEMIATFTGVASTGCIDPLACNYISDTCATDDGSCTYPTITNDNCATPLALTSAVAEVGDFSESCSSNTLGECGNPGGGDLWYSFSPTIGGTVNIDFTAGLGQYGALSLYDDCNTAHDGTYCTYSWSESTEQISIQMDCSESILLHIMAYDDSYTGTFTVTVTDGDGMGCTDPTACNYSSNPCAVENGSCAYVVGCTSPSACNYDPSATCDDEFSCIYPYGCDDPTACNYDPASPCDDGSCLYITPEVNDVCDGALPLAFGVVNTVDNTNSCADDPEYIFCGNGEIRDVWYSVSSVTGGDITITPTLNGTITGAQIAVYANCDTDYTIACTTGAGSLTFNPDCGTTFLIQMGGVNEEQGTFDVEVTEAAMAGAGCTDPTACNYDSDPCVTEDGSCVFPTVANESCSNAIALTEGVVVAADVSTACVSHYAECVGQFNTDLWYALTSTKGGPVTLNASVITPSYMIAIVYDSCEDGTLIDCGGDFNSSFDFTFDTECGNTYYVQIVDYNEGGGTVEISFTEDTVMGCSDPTACNYRACAIEDGSCILPDGCTDVAACNYDATALCDDGSCNYGGCTYPAACNYDAAACDDDGSCEFTSCTGCTYPDATNYNMGASIDDGSFLFAPALGCDGNDVNNDGLVGSGDLLQILGSFGSSCD